MIKTTYFQVTTLSTIGFGDILPYTNTERILMSIIFVAGVAVFSLMMQNPK